MTQSLAIDADGDLYLGINGNIPILSGIDAVAQNSVTALRAQRGEMIYAQLDGMPYMSTVFSTYSAQQFEVAARTILAGIDGVQKILSFTASVSGDVLTYAAKLQTIYGTVAING